MVDEPDLTARLRNARAEYEDGWKLVDTELYALCHRRRDHEDFDEVYPKVAIVGRVYMAGVSRAWGGDRDRDPETETARALVGQAALIREGLQRLEGRPFDRQTAGAIIELHADVTNAVSGRSVKFLTSFVSKYLHFHRPIVPIFDTRAQAAIGKLVDQKLVREVRIGLLKGVPDYRNFVAKFVALHERAHAETGLEPTVKELDHLLWR